MTDPSIIAEPDAGSTQSGKRSRLHEPTITIVSGTCRLAAFLQCGAWYHIDTRWENVPTRSCNLCNCPITASTSRRCQRSVALKVEGNGCYDVTPQLNLCDQCCDKVYDHSNEVGSQYSMKNYFMGWGSNYKEIIQSVRKKYKISPIPLTSALMALNRLGMDTDLIDEGFCAS